MVSDTEGSVAEQDEIVGGWGKLRNEKLRNLCCSTDVIRTIK
jgi:hypothetical protein